MTFGKWWLQGAVALTVGMLAAGGALAQVNHNPTTEPRVGQPSVGTHLIVFTFDKPVTGGTATVSEGVAAVGSTAFVGNEMQVTLTGVTDIQYVTVDVSNVVAADGGTGGTGSARVGFLRGDVNGTRTVSLLDLLNIAPQILKPVTPTNYLDDVNLSGTISLLDLLVVAPSILNKLPTP